MAIVLSPEVERQIEEIVRSGAFASADAFVRQSVERTAKRRPGSRSWPAAKTLSGGLEEGLRDIQQGNYTVYDSEGSRALAEEIEREGRIAMGLPGGRIMNSSVHSPDQRKIAVRSDLGGRSFPDSRWERNESLIALLRRASISGHFERKATNGPVVPQGCGIIPSRTHATSLSLCREPTPSR